MHQIVDYTIYGDETPEVKKALDILEDWLKKVNESDKNHYLHLMFLAGLTNVSPDDPLSQIHYQEECLTEKKLSVYCKGSIDEPPFRRTDSLIEFSVEEAEDSDSFWHSILNSEKLLQESGVKENELGIAPVNFWGE